MRAPTTPSPTTPSRTGKEPTMKYDIIIFRDYDGKTKVARIPRR